MDNRYYFNERGFRGFWSVIMVKEEDNIITNNGVSEIATIILNQKLKTIKYLKKRCFSFKLIVEKEIDFGKQRDFFSSNNFKSSTLTGHIPFDVYNVSNEEMKVKLVINACLKLLVYWYDNLKHPKDFELDTTIEELTIYLKDRNYYLTNFKDYVKPYDRISFGFRTTIGIGAKIDDLEIDLKRLEDFITNGLSKNRYGSELKRLEFGYELFCYNGRDRDFFTGTEMFVREFTMNKSILIVRQQNYNSLLTLNKNKKWINFKNLIIESLFLKKLENKAKKRSDFLRLREDIIELLIKYENCVQQVI